MRLLLAGLALACGAAGAAEAPDPATSLREGMPKDVAALIQRMVECNHWAGEEPYEATRRHEIELALRRLQCDKLDADQKAIRSKYPDNEEIGRRLDAARERYR